MASVKNQKVMDFLKAVSSKSPAPGGGCTAAVVGAMAAALVNKVVGLTIEKKGYEKVQEEMKKLSNEVARVQKELLELASEDAEAYLAVVKSKGNQEAIRKAAEVPLETAEKSLEVLKAASYVSEHGNQNLRSDAFCAIELATAAIYGALENVRVNLPEIKDERLVNDLKDKIEGVLNGANQLVKP